MNIYKKAPAKGLEPSTINLKDALPTELRGLLSFPHSPSRNKVEITTYLILS